MTLTLVADDVDPVRPDLETPTPAEMVAKLSRADRKLRLAHLLDQKDQIEELAMREHLRGREVVAKAVLFSGGNDSTTLAHMLKDEATHAVHANTTIGIEQTRQYVRDTCKKWGLPLIEKVAPVSYRELVIERGFPGPAMHFKMYGRLKERCLDAARIDLGVHRSRKKVAIFYAGRRRAESERRKDVPLHEADGSVIWVSPIAMWTKLDLTVYRQLYPDVPRNEVSDTLHMSGECLCGAFAHRGELDEIAEWYPETAAEIRALEAEVRAAGHEEPFCHWGHGQGKASKKGPLCSSCTVSPDQMELIAA